MFVFYYDHACGARASHKARLRDAAGALPPSIAMWVRVVRWLVDRFHYKTHKGRICTKYCNPNAWAACRKHNTEVQEHAFKSFNQMAPCCVKQRASTFNLTLHMRNFYRLNSA